MDNETRIEILAMNIWLKIFGVTALTPEWIEFAKQNPDKANSLRSQAAEMIGVANSHAGSNAPPKTSHHHSLGWLP